MNLAPRFFKVVLTGTMIATAVANLPAIAQSTTQPDLRQGGYVIYFRHAQASDDAKPADNLPAQVKNCKGQRHVTKAGIEMLAAMSKQWKSAKIPVGKAISSPSCWALESAWYMLGSSVVVAPTLEGTPREQIWMELRPFLVTAPPPGTNTVIFAHGTNIKALTGFSLAEGEAVVYQPDGKGEFTYITHVKPQKWTW
jgi:hypothetical protein